MMGSRVTTSWASSIVGDAPPPRHARRPLREAKAQDQVTIYMPRFIGCSKPELYIDWECELNAIFASHNFSERKKVEDATRTFTNFASLWWTDYCQSYPDYIPTTWNDLKLAMHYKFIPSYYTRSMVRKLQNLSQGSDTVQEYFDALETTLFHAFIEESEDDFMDRFWTGLNHDIQDILMHE
jgi:hypothetical protein